MKTKLLTLLGIVLATATAFAVAGGLFDAPWGIGLPVVQQGSVSGSSVDKLEQPLVFTKDLSALKGHAVFYTVDGGLFKEDVTAEGLLATSSKKVATGSIRLVDQNEDVVLFVNEQIVPADGLGDYKNELWLLDKRTGAAKKIFENVTQEGSVSAASKLIVIRAVDSQLMIFDYDGYRVTSTGTYGASPVFSPSGDRFAYIKLNAGHTEMGDPDMFQGVAIYNLATKEDAVVQKSAQNSNEWMIAGWSSDGQRVYYPSFDSTWSVGVDGKAKRQETNKTVEGPRVPAYLSHLLFADDGTVAFGEAEGIWAFTIGKDGGILSSKKVVEGTPGSSSRLDWLVKGKSVSSHLYGKTATTVYRISDLNR